MKQIALDIGLARGPTLASFCAGPNEAALKHLQLWAGSPTRSPVPTYLWGPSGSGKTHLLKAVAETLREQGAAAGWLDATVHEPPQFDERWAVVLLDDAHLYTAVQQHAAFNWFVNAQTLQR
ncbi:MAG TPA: DnaA/Hda family protein, partial [Ramlibacter sp.]|nr:DnaA/Hda family protein [Ramlibacter sp.]